MKNVYKIKDFHYQISLYCPGECKNCSIWKYDKSEITKDEIDIDLFEKTLSSDILSDVSYIQLTAGEVQLSPKYVDVVKTIAKHKPNAFIHTNISGWYPKKHYEVVKECLEYVPKENFRIDISLDGPKEVYETIRFVKNGYEKVFQTIDSLKEITDNIRVVFTIYKENFQYMDWLVETANKYEIGYYFEFVRESNFLNNLGTTTMNQFTQEELDFIEKRLNQCNFITRDDRKIKWERAKEIYKGDNLLFNCHMGKEGIVLDPYGNIYPCIEGLDILKMGNVKDFNGNLDNLLYSKQALEVIDLIDKKQCQPCGMLCIHKLDAT